jgi:hypothetical protein
MKKLLILSVMAAAMSWTSLGWASEIYGKIFYKGAPLKAADISIQDKTTKTNDLGFYSVSLDPGSYVMKIKLPDGVSREQKVEVFPQATEKNLKLE